MTQTMEPISGVLKQPQRVLSPTKRPLERVVTQKPEWWLNSKAAKLPRDADGEHSRVQCPRCFGRGSSAGLALERRVDTVTNEILTPGCVACWGGYGEGPCPAHKCHVCDGDGFVCPQCRGYRVVKQDLPFGHPDFGHCPDEHRATAQYGRCNVCCERNQIKPDNEAAARQRYLVKHPVPPWYRHATRS